MLQAAHFFQQENGNLPSNSIENGKGESPQLISNDRFAAWEQVSSLAWRVKRREKKGNYDSALRDDMTPEQAAILASVDRFLSSSEQALNSNNSTTPLVPPGFGAANGGLSTKIPRDQWIHDVQDFLGKASNDELLKLYQDQLGIHISAPLKLSSKTMTQQVLTPPSSQQTHQEGTFCVQAMTSFSSNTEARNFTMIEFTSYQPNNNKTKEEEYIPSGYEELELSNGFSNNNSQSGSSSSPIPPTNVSMKEYYIMEVRHKKETGARTILEEIAIVWKEQTDNDAARSALSPTSIHSYRSINTLQSVKGVQVKVISTKTWLKSLDDYWKQRQQHQNELTPLDEEWILSELENAESLPLPQVVGSDYQINNLSNPQNGNHSWPSLLFVISFDSSHAQLPPQNGSSSLWSRIHTHNSSESSSLGDMIGHVVFKFQRRELVQQPPLTSHMSLSHASIGRKVVIHNNSISEEESFQKLLESSLWNAERFVPESKRQQWEQLPDVLITVAPHPALSNALRDWLLSSTMRRSAFDQSLGNALLYLPYWQFYTPPSCYFIDKNMLDATVLYSIKSIQQHIEQVTLGIKTRAMMHRQSESNGDDATTIHNLCSQSSNFSSAIVVLRGYVERTLAALQVERLRCFEDLKKHDMYSVLWKGRQGSAVEIPPPIHPHKACHRCCPAQNEQSRSSLCGHHAAALHVEEETGRTPMPGKPILIRTKRQLERLPMVLANIVPPDCICVKIVIPGVAESYPLISIGDFVRLMFQCPPGEYSISTEIIAEVAGVVVKTEEVTLRLPSPFQRQNGLPWASFGCLPYLQALLHTDEYVIDARPILQTIPRMLFSPCEAKLIPEESRIAMLDQFRFDVRVGFQGGRGFDIVNQVLGEAIDLVEVPPRPHPTKKKLGKRQRKEMLQKQQRKDDHLRRVLAPVSGHAAVGGRPSSGVIDEYCFTVNEEQQQAVRDIVFGSHGRAPYIIEGPAGTGKSMCVCESIMQVIRNDKDARILVCAPSDAACDVLASRLLPLLRSPIGGWKSLLRVNWWSRKLASVPPILLSCSPMDDLGGIFRIPSSTEIKNASVIVCQCFVAECLELAGPRGWVKAHFTHLFIDETSQAMECEALVPIFKVGNECSIVLAGDPKQLGPSIRDPVAAEMGLGMSIQERLLKLPLYSQGEYRVITRLVKNYRSNEALLTVPSSLFYAGNLQCMAPKDVADPFENLGDLGPASFPLLLCNVAHGKERSKLDTPSFYNLEECNAILELIEGLLRCKTKEGVTPLHTGQICVITPFRAQVLALRNTLRNAGLGGVNIGVVEDFQGQEQKVVFISTVLTRDHKRWNRPAMASGTPPKSSHSTATATTATNTGATSITQQRLGFLHDPKRFNVAITRAHALCIIVGHADYLEQSGTYWAALMDHIKRNKGVLGSQDDQGDEEDNENEGHEDNDEDLYGVADLLRRVEELRLLGAGVEEEKDDLFYYYSDVPQWKVMLS